VIADDKAAEFEDRLRAQFDAQPPPDEERVSRIAALFAAISLRRARDAARARIAGRQTIGSSDTCGGYAPDYHDVRSDSVGVHERSMNAGRVPHDH
jgi:hypothetical protein